MHLHLFASPSLPTATSRFLKVGAVKSPAVGTPPVLPLRQISSPTDRASGIKRIKGEVNICLYHCFASTPTPTELHCILRPHFPVVPSSTFAPYMLHPLRRKLKVVSPASPLCPPTLTSVRVFGSRHRIPPLILLAASSISPTAATATACLPSLLLLYTHTRHSPRLECHAPFLPTILAILNIFPFLFCHIANLEAPIPAITTNAPHCDVTRRP